MTFIDLKKLKYKFIEENNKIPNELFINYKILDAIDYYMYNNSNNLDKALRVKVIQTIKDGAWFEADLC